MGRFSTADVSFDVPDGWQDRALVAFSGPTPLQGPRPNVVITREPLAEGETLRGYSNRQLVEIGQRLSGFRLHASTMIRVGGVPAVDLRFAWHSDLGAVEQRMVLIPCGRVVVTLTATAALESVPQLATVFDGLLSSVALAEPPAAGVLEDDLPAPAPTTPTALEAPSTAPATTDEIPAAPSCDLDGRARRAAAAHWQVEVDALRVSDLHARVPWASRHELVAVTGEDERRLVVALGLGDPIVFHEGADAAELGRFFRAENIALPTGLPAHVLAQTVHALLRGKAGTVITQAWLERLRGRLLLEERDVVLALQRHAEPPRLGPTADGDHGWELEFASVTPQGGIDRWSVHGDRARLRSVAREEAAPAGSFELQRWMAPPRAPVPSPLPPPSIRIAPPPPAGRGGTRVFTIPRRRDGR